MDPVVIPRSGHPISRREIDSHCVTVLYRLYRAGHQAYLVGGGVRDLLLGIRPKDFDVATDAHPARIKKLFRNCVLVGRRFRLAHVRFGTTVIEVSTFRRTPEPDEMDAAEDDADLLIRRDNTFGTPEDDARRRDFTINALFYDIGTFSLIDYVGGLRDLEDGFVRSIGDPHVRFQEDPVRMIRAAKFAGRLGFEIAPEDDEAIRVDAERIRLASVSRLLEEVLKFLRAGASAPSCKLLHELGLLDHILPGIARHLERTEAAKDPENARFYRYLFALDEALGADDAAPPTNSFVLAALFAPLLDEALANAGGRSPWEAGAAELEDAFDEVVVPVLKRLTVSRRDSERLRHVLLAQPRLAQATPTGRRERGVPLASKPWFHEAVRVLGLAAAVDEGLEPAARAWEERARDVEPVDDEPRARRRRRGGGGGGEGRRQPGRRAPRF